MTTRSVSVRLDLETAQAIAKSREFGTAMTSAMDQAEGASRRTGAALDDIGGKAGRLALGGAAALGSIAAAAIGWETAWAGVTKTVDGSAEEMQALEDGLRGLATTLPATHDEIAGVAEAAGQLGVAREDVVDFTETMVALGETTNLVAEDAATSIAQISNVMGTAGEDVDNFGATLVALGNDGASTEKQILDMAQRIAGAGAQVGLTETDILAVANAAASIGIEAEAGGSAISRVFSDMAKATAQGGDQLEAYAEVAGVSASQFARAFEQDPARAFATFTAGLDRIKESGGDVFTVLDELKLSDIRVSQALLGMAASGDLLSDSLELGSRAWEENTALAREAAKRYETTASETQVAWNKMKDAGIEAGDSLLPVVGAIADKVGAVADAFGKLPDPVQGAFTQLLAIGTLTAGAGWLGIKTISSINGTRTSMAALRAEGGRTATAMGGLSKAAGGLAVLTTAAIAVKALQDSIDESLPGMETLTGRLIDIAELPTGFSGSLGSAFASLGDSIDRITDKGKLDAFNDTVLTPLRAVGLEARDLKEGRAEIEALDQALAGLVALGNADLAADALGNISDQYNLSESQLKGLMGLMPAYEDALAGQANEARLDADAHEYLYKNARRAASGISYTAEQIQAAQDAYADQVDSARGVAEEFFNLGDSVDDAKVSLGGWITDLEEMSAALDNFTNNSIKAAKRGLNEDLIATLEEAGPAGALRMKQLANATEEEIARANRAWRRGGGEIREYIGVTTEVPDELTTTVNVDAAGALNSIGSVAGRLQALDGDSATVRINYETTGRDVVPDGPFRPGLAGGGSVPKTGGGYRDRHHYLLADGEEVISNRHGQADRHRPLLKAINAGRLADGGTATGDLFRLSPRAAPMSSGFGRSTAIAASTGVAIDYDRLASGIANEFRSAADDANEAIGRGIARESGRPWSEKTKRTRAAGHGGYRR